MVNKNAHKKNFQNPLMNGGKKNNNDENDLSSRDDLLQSWVINSWFKGDINQKELKNIFISLFVFLYSDISKNFSGNKRDELISNFINIVFPTALDVYKWHESQKASQDIGLLRALKEIPLCQWYKELVVTYNKIYNKK